MTVPFSYIEKPDAFDAIDRLNGLESPVGVVDEMVRSVRSLGFASLFAATIDHSGEFRESNLLAKRSVREWLDVYISRRFIEFDPLMRQLSRSHTPYRWRDIPEDPANPRGAEVIRVRREFGFQNGLVVPIRSSDRSFGFVTMNVHSTNLPEHNLLQAHLIALYGYERLRALSGRAPATSSLTAREREVLSWASRGKSAWEIGEVLKISKRTVDEHTQSAIRKLGASNRTHAVVIALRDQIISL